ALEGGAKNRPSKAIAFERREQSIFVVPAVPLSLPPYKTGGRSARSAVWGESLLHDNGQVPSAPTAKGHQRGCSGASDARPSAPPCTFRRLSEAGWELLSPHHCIFQYDYF